MVLHMFFVMALLLSFAISDWSVSVSGKRINTLNKKGTKAIMKIPFVKKCVCDINEKGSTANCQGQGQNLKEIPSLPSNITTLIVTGFTVSYLTESFFSNIEDLNIRSLNISKNNIQDISTGAFKNLKTLRKLDLSFNNFTSFSLRDALPSLSSACLSVLSLNGMDWIDLAPRIFESVALTNITKMSLSQNLLRHLSGYEFSNLKTLETLDVSKNELIVLTLVELVNVKNLYLQENEVFSPFFCKTYLTYIIEIEVLNLQGNQLHYVTKQTFGCMKRLKTLILDNNPITTLVNGMLNGMPFIEELHVGNLWQINQIEDTAFESRSLKRLYFRDNEFFFNYSSNLTQIFKYVPQLETLNITNNYLNPPLNMSDIFSNLHSLQILDMGKTRLYEMPENVFPHMKNLSKLYLNGNRIASWDGPKVFGYNSGIKSLHLIGNNISVVNQTSFPNSLLLSLRELDLSDNQFACTCENLWFRDWIRDNVNNEKHNIALLGNKTKYMCKLPKRLSDAGVNFIDYNPTEESCSEDQVWIYPVVEVAALIVLTITIATVLYKCRWNIRYKMYLSKRHKYTRLANDEEFVYAGYVIYSDNDKEWVNDVFRKRLEDKEGHRLCVRLRDFVAEKSIVDNIAENMILSRKILIVISNNFAKDDWCQFELNLAQHRYVSGENDLILVMLNEVNSDNLSESLHILITTMSCAIWSNGVTGETLFWMQVIEQLK